MMRIKIKNPPLDQTGGPREDELEKNQSQPVLQRKRHPRQMASQLMGPNLNTSLLNKTLPADHGPVQPWLSNLARQENPHESFDELTDTPFDFSAFMMNRLNVETLTPELLAGPTFKLMKGTCKSLVKLEYFFEEVYKATTEQLDWHNPEGQQYPHDLRKPLPLIPNSRGRQVIPFDHFINNDLAYLYGGVSSRTYATSVTKTKAADYSHIKWIEELIPYAMESARGVNSRRRIIAITKLQIVEWHGYKHLDWTTVRRYDDKLHTFKKSDFKRLRLQDIEDMLLLLDCDEIPKRPTMYLNLWSYKAVRLRYSNPMIQPEPEGSTQGYPLVSVEVLRFDTLAGNPFKEILLKLNLPDHRILNDGGEVKEFQRSFHHSDNKRLSRSDEVLTLKNFKKDATLKLFKSKNQERCSRSHSRQDKEQAQDLKSMITTSNHKLMIEVKDYELKTKVEA
ncbi:hypothetical protein Tco_0786492 [Tanacetum coccineum]